jgi:hypothetical protein
MLTPTGGLTVKGGNQLQAQTTTLTKMTPFSQNSAAGLSSNAQYSSSLDSDQSVTPDVTNNRLLLFAPGQYLVDFSISGFGSAADGLIVQVVLNGVVQAELTAEQAVPAASGKVNLGACGIINVTRPLGGASTQPLELWAKVTGGSNFTPEYVNFLAQRIG